MVSVSITEAGVEMEPFADIRVHPAAELFPLIEGREFASLVEDIEEHGLHDPVVFTPDGQLLDGRNRWRACKMLGRTPDRRVEPSEPYAFVVSANIHRRHLDDTQRGMIAARIAERRHGQRKDPSRPIVDSADVVAGQRPDASSEATAPKGPLPPSHSQAAELLKVSRSMVQRGREVLKKGQPALVDAVEQGKVPMATAARVAAEPAEVQQDFVEKVKAGANPAKVISPRPPQGKPEAPISRRSARRHQYLTVSGLQSIRDALGGLKLVVKTTPDGLDPGIGAEEAARLAIDLRDGRKVLSRVIDMLEDHTKNREEPTT